MKINRDSKIFQKLIFLKEQYKFHLLLKMFWFDEHLFHSDEETYIIGRGSPGYPIWIWTKDNIDYLKVQDIEEDLQEFLNPGKNNITSKKELYDYFAKEYDNISDYSEMGFLICKKMNEVKKSDGYMDKPDYGDKMLLAKYWIEERKDDGEIVSMTDALQMVDYWLEQENFYVWRNSTGKVVSTASFDVMYNQAKITNVYTAKDERNKGYCTSLVSEVTRLILENNLVPMLYTNNKEASKHAYSKVGFEQSGSLINFTITKDEYL